VINLDAPPIKKGLKMQTNQLVKIAAKHLVLIGLGLSSLVTNAHDGISTDYDNLSTRLFSSYESNGNDFIEGIGIGTTFKENESNLGFQVNTSFNNAEVLTTDGFTEEYFAWQGSMKFGYFSRVSVYAEVGIDLTELLFHDLRDDDHDGYDYDYYDDHHHSHYSDNIDAFIGIGAGIQTGPIKFEAFTRLREIDSQYWEADSEAFSGIQISINF